MSIDLSTIVDIYQYRLLKNRHIAVITQRAGRATRSKGLVGRFTFLIEENLYSDNATNGFKDSSKRAADYKDERQNVAFNTLELYRQLASLLDRRLAGRFNVARYKLSVRQQQKDNKDRSTLNDEKATTNAAILRAFAVTIRCRRRLVYDFFSPLGRDTSLDSSSPLLLKAVDLCCDNYNLELRLAVQRDMRIRTYSPKQKLLILFITIYLQQQEQERAQRIWIYQMFPALPSSQFSHSLL